jgi:sRNA-binding protein
MSPLKTPYASLPGTAVDIEEIRKDVMHTAAERAKARRQMEEEEREAQKERARRKAAEIEERIKTEKAQQTEKEEVPKLPLVRRFRPIIF